jgi:hypothetical protein
VSTQDFWKVPYLSLGAGGVGFRWIARRPVSCGEVKGGLRDMGSDTDLSQRRGGGDVNVAAVWQATWSEVVGSLERVSWTGSVSS